jgi:hypothetical protein
MLQPAPANFVELEGVTTLKLADLINVKLTSGLTSIARAQDIADVIGLIHAKKLGASYS